MKHLLYFLKQIHVYSGIKLYINLLLMTVMSLLEGIGILLLIPMISMIGIADLDAGEKHVAAIVMWLRNFPTAVSLAIILAIFILIVIVQNLIQHRVSIQNAMIQQSFFRYMRLETYRAILYANWDFFVKKRKSDLINILTTEIVRASGGTISFLQFLTALIFTFIQITFAFYLSPYITSFILVFGFILIFVNRTFLRRSLTLGNRNYELGKGHLAGISDQINGIKDIKCNTLEESRIEWYESITKQMQEEQFEFTKLRTKSQFYYKTASAILIASFIYLAINLFQAQSGQLMLIVVLFSRLWPRVAGIQSSMEQIAATLPAFKAVWVLQNECKAAKEFERRGTELKERLNISNGIECRGVYFRYNQSNLAFALRNIHLNIPANQTTAIVGRSGAGKSTLIDIIMGLNQPDSGDVLVDGVPLTTQNLIALRNSISYVPQDPFLFNASIRENLLLMCEHATDADIWQALEFSSAAEFVQKLPEGLDTIIGDRGIVLSGGERQRVILARAILRSPSILVLDEATSALDTENELNIKEALDKLKGKMTIIVIAHRLSTIRNADQIVVLEKGKIIQNGRYLELASEKQGMFSRLLGKQLEASV
ncbi:ABC transporter ATP-binding protein [Neobacillus sp. YIM B06451]|uniref:ABC transporter ATP-binding protein n=1 Tax=Neobacillus sp. YIM B06451 TaxID=3070994 RepID=UPI00292FA352|nr:ABC transporter ATP-binding protein [Neobacillus sp. YIM B06451]